MLLDVEETQDPWGHFQQLWRNRPDNFRTPTQSWESIAILPGRRVVDFEDPDGRAQLRLRMRNGEPLKSVAEAEEILKNPQRAARYARLLGPHASLDFGVVRLAPHGNAPLADTTGLIRFVAMSVREQLNQFATTLRYLERWLTASGAAFTHERDPLGAGVPAGLLTDSALRQAKRVMTHTRANSIVHAEDINAARYDSLKRRQGYLDRVEFAVAGLSVNELHAVLRFEWSPLPLPPGRPESL